MTHIVDNDLTKAFATAAWLLEPADHGDVLTTLSQALGRRWQVHRETDFEGHVSVIALPADDRDGAPTFILYEEDGRARVGTIRDDEWQCARGFDRIRQGMDAILLAARLYLMEHSEGLQELRLCPDSAP